MNTKPGSYSAFISRLCQLTLGLFLIFLLSCNSTPVTEGEDIPLIQTPREAYWSALDSNQLTHTQMAQAWQQAGVRALEDSVFLQLPFKETGYFRAEVPEAYTYRLALKTGELLHIDLSEESDSTLFFVDFFRLESTDSSTQLLHLFSAENYQTDSLSYEAQQAGTYLLRIQPELLASARFTLQLLVQPVYGVFPVQGKGNPDIWSSFGDPRDGGRRSHKGIDIFARRGTPTLAAIDGVIRRVKDEGLGGKQVWLYDEERQQSLYYAHLDSQQVIEGQLVQAGDTVGTVGNTGNAKTTRPHLHFSIYRRGDGAIDPKPFVAFQQKKAPRVRANLSRLGQLSRVKNSNTRLRAAPHPRADQLATLDRHFPVEILGASKYWYRVRSSNGFSGYLPATDVEDISRSIEKFTVAMETELLRAPHPEAVAAYALPSNAEVEVIGKNGNYQLVRGSLGEQGWMPRGER